ncbi:hypothetical protein [Methylicorpusculum sp.]|uniref:hypothetical protein n=1 Tax=Methylicorpusculum sp. TaxID=2713644 RepID=UPI002AB95B56|nr:hypothetical protein [Methylicorpusculum sp.]MDZ4151849.1 hypothetical protein [Methylicorpusculum sp.]
MLNFRVPNIDRFVDFFYEKWRPINDRFSNKNTSVKIRCLTQEFTKQELLQIGFYIQHLGADYGELDDSRYRDRNKYLFYFFAKIPFGPPNSLSRKDAYKALELMGIAIINNFAKLALS